MDIKIKCHPMFVPFAAAVIVLGGRGLWPVLAAAFVHEAGHAACMVVLGLKIEAVTLMPGGADIRYRGGASPYWADLAAALAGPAANLAVCFLLAGAGGGLRAFVGMNLALCLFNLLPIYPLDGGRSLYLALEYFFGPYIGWTVSGAVSLAVCMAMTAAAAWSAHRGGGLWTFMLFGYLLISQPLLGRQNK